MDQKVKIYFLISMVTLFASIKASPHLTIMGENPNWEELDAFQYTVTKDDFVYALNNIYAPRETSVSCITVGDDRVKILKEAGSEEFFEIYFSGSNEGGKVSRERSLSDVHISIDPGHIGGNFSEMEQRHFSLNGSSPMREGEMVLKVALALERKLIALGADVSLLRWKNEPVTELRPVDFLKRAAVWQFRKRGKSGIDLGFSKEKQLAEITRLSQKLFYQVSEIRARAKLVNDVLKPDLVLALHMNAAPWPNSSKPSLVKGNHAHILVNGAYGENELAYDDIRFEMLLKLLSGAWRNEVLVSEAISNTLKDQTGLPPFIYRGNYAVGINNNPYVWGRNLLANRLYRCPVVYLEPYVANSEAVFNQIQRDETAFIEEYSQFVIDGLLSASIF